MWVPLPDTRWPSPPTPPPRLRHAATRKIHPVSGGIAVSSTRDEAQRDDDQSGRDIYMKGGGERMTILTGVGDKPIQGEPQV